MNRIRVLIVDDSVVFRSQIRAALERSPELEVVGVANHGGIALQKLSQLSVDVVTLDMEMPEMDGLETIRRIRAEKFRVRIIAFSSKTQRGSEATLDALSLGADDFLPKPDFSDLGGASPDEVIARELNPKVLQFKERSVAPVSSPSDRTQASEPSPAPNQKISIQDFKPGVIVIGSSTGGPQALESILQGLQGPFPVPVLIAQHMPPVFTASLAKRLSESSGVLCQEGVSGEKLMANRIYMAPGDYHMTIDRMGSDLCVHLDQSPRRNSVRPAVDPLFESTVKHYGPKVLGIILTGMGEDGWVGCQAIKNARGAVMIQNRESCVVFGMPRAVFERNLYDEVADLERIRQVLKKQME